MRQLGGNVTRKTGPNSGREGRAEGGDPESPPANDPPKRPYLRLEIPPVLDTALAQYAQAVALTKSSAARSLLMRILVKRSVHVPDPVNEPA